MFVLESKYPSLILTQGTAVCFETGATSACSSGASIQGERRGAGIGVLVIHRKTTAQQTHQPGHQHVGVNLISPPPYKIHPP